MSKLSKPAAQVLAMVQECLRMNEKEQAVIEAAKADVHALRVSVGVRQLDTWDRLVRAVEALQEVEDG